MVESGDNVLSPYHYKVTGEAISPQKTSKSPLKQANLSPTKLALFENSRDQVKEMPSATKLADDNEVNEQDDRLQHLKLDSAKPLYSNDSMVASTESLLESNLDTPSASLSKEGAASTASSTEQEKSSDKASDESAEPSSQLPSTSLEQPTYPAMFGSEYNAEAYTGLPYPMHDGGEGNNDEADASTEPQFFSCQWSDPAVAGHADISAPVPTVKCTRIFKTPGELFTHLNREHIHRAPLTTISNDKIHFYCTWQDCNVIVGKKDHLISHLRVHLPEWRPYECSICAKSFKRPQDKKKHERTHEKAEAKKNGAMRSPRPNYRNLTPYSNSSNDSSNRRGTNSSQHSSQAAAAAVAAQIRASQQMPNLMIPPHSMQNLQPQQPTPTSLSGQLMHQQLLQQPHLAMGAHSQSGAQNAQASGNGESGRNLDNILMSSAVGLPQMYGEAEYGFPAALGAQAWNGSEAWFGNDGRGQNMYESMYMPYGVSNYAYGHAVQGAASGDKADQIPRSEYNDAFAAYMQGPGMYGSAAPYGYALPGAYGDAAAAFPYGVLPAGQPQQQAASSAPQTTQQSGQSQAAPAQSAQIPANGA